MITIHKFPIEIKRGVQTIAMPDGARIIHVGLDPIGTPCLWARVNTAHPMTLVEVILVGTGWEMNAHGEHLGSFVQGGFVWHVFTA